MTRKLFLLTILLAATAVFLSACAEKEDLLLEEPEEEEVLLEEVAPPPWDDGVITITVGRFASKEEVIQELRASDLDREDVPYIENTILSERFTITPPEKRYSVNIAVVTMLEAGITEPATLQEIKERYREQGYGPLTLEEVVELRLQFKDQPDSSTGHRMNNFRTLLTGDSKQSGRGKLFSYYLCHFRYSDMKTRKVMFRSSGTGELGLFDPNDKYVLRRGGGYSFRPLLVNPSLELPTRFAAMVRGSVVRW